MSLYQKILIGAAVVGLIGIPVLVLDFSDLSWHHNQEGYWGMISMVALIGAVLFNRRSQQLEERLKSKEREDSN